MTDAASQEKKVQLTISEKLAVLTLGETVINIASDGNVAIYTNDSIETKPAPVNGNADTNEENQVSISEDLSSVSLYGTTVSLTAEGIVVATDGNVKIKPAHISADKSLSKAVGDTDENGWTYIGNSPLTRQPMFVAPQDAGVLNWKDAKKAADALRKQGVFEARVPAGQELDLIFNNKAQITGLNQNNAGKENLYWSSNETGACGWYRNLKNGHPNVGLKKDAHSVRLVCSGKSTEQNKGPK